MCVCVCVCVYVCMCECACVGMWVCAYVGMWIIGYMGMLVCGYVSMAFNSNNTVQPTELKLWHTILICEYLKTVCFFLKIAFSKRVIAPFLFFF